MNYISKNIFFVLAILASFLLFSCNNDDDTDSLTPDIEEGEVGRMRFEFDNIAGNRNLQLNTGTYQTASGEEFNVTTFDYYLSNFVFIDKDGNEYAVPQDESYKLVRESDRESQFFGFDNVPAGDYTAVRFVVGVDSLRNTKDISERTGALDPANGMYWSWNSGYIFVKLEGNSPAAPENQNGEHIFRYHIGGFGGFDSPTINNVKTVEIPLTETAVVRKNNAPLLHFTVDVLKLFEAPNPFLISENPTVMFAPFSVKIAENYVRMFAFDHLH
ncbi:MAG: hypothetical protein JJT94_00650 [Bernardetiaceae bacterium]|nr:hypothetical protein [Bernardetiaceae bacterium]